MKPKPFKVGDRVRIDKIPPNLADPAGIGTQKVFKQSLGKTFRVAGISKYGLLELVVTKTDTVWIEPQFVTRVV